jgi:hypothetical protein
MFGLLDQILCWIRQIGAMVFNAGIDLVNAFLAGLAATVSAFVDAWPIDMPALPSVPSELLTGYGWLKWTPLPIDAGLAFFAFSVSVWILWAGLSIVLRWLKVGD